MPSLLAWLSCKMSKEVGGVSSYHACSGENDSDTNGLLT